MGPGLVPYCHEIITRFDHSCSALAWALHRRRRTLDVFGNDRIEAGMAGNALKTIKLCFVRRFQAGNFDRNQLFTLGGGKLHCSI